MVRDHLYIVINLIFQARNVVRDLDPMNDLAYLRVRSGKTEILVAPGRKLQVKKTWICGYHAAVVREGESEGEEKRSDIEIQIFDE